MNGFLLKNGDDVLGLAVIDESRKIQDITYLSGEKNLLISFTDGESDVFQTKIDCQFEAALFAKKKILIGHFPHDDFAHEPSDEYFVPLSL